ncbi:MAG: NADH-quinone oxidoreductase subunit N [Phycisphaerales bacterium]
MTDRLTFLYPEIALFIGTCVVMVLGLSRTLKMRKAAALVTGLSLLVALYASVATTPRIGEALCPISGVCFSKGLTAAAGQMLLPQMPVFAKTLIAIVGLILLLPCAGTVDRSDEEAIASGRRSFDPLRSNRAEFYAFFLFSLTGLMLTASADDLIWLFLALELTSLPTYIMVAISTARNKSREAGVKYFFLGALGAAVFLYGFALIYGGTGSTNFNAIAANIRDNGLNSITLAGMLLAILGISFKIAAVPMHFYTPDVYEGAAPQVSGFLAFVPKTAGFLSILLLCATVGWAFAPGQSGLGGLMSGDATSPLQQTTGNGQLPELIRITLWVMAALTMTVGNVLAILQSNVKRMLAYSSIAHSGYMLVGVIAGPGDGTFTHSGVAAVLFYLLCYGVMNAGTFAVLAALERTPGKDGEPREIETVADLKGLCATHPQLGWSMVICSLSLLGLPPLLGFFGKLPLFTAGISANEMPLVVILALNSAIAAFYYLKLAFTPMLEKPDAGSEAIHHAPFFSRRVGAMVSAGGVVLLAVLGSPLIDQATKAARVPAVTPSVGPGGTEVVKPVKTEPAPQLSRR